MWKLSIHFCIGASSRHKPSRFCFPAIHSSGYTPATCTRRRAQRHESPYGSKAPHFLNDFNACLPHSNSDTEKVPFRVVDGAVVSAFDRVCDNEFRRENSSAGQLSNVFVEHPSCYS